MTQISKQCLILKKKITSLATEMRKMASKPVTFSFLPTLPLPPLECALVNCNAICVMMVGAQQIEELNLNEFLIRFLD